MICGSADFAYTKIHQDQTCNDTLERKSVTALIVGNGWTADLTLIFIPGYFVNAGTMRMAVTGACPRTRP
jgi:hypothetical protein